jgi:hypothetical protein
MHPTKIVTIAVAVCSVLLSPSGYTRTEHDAYHLCRSVDRSRRSDFLQPTEYREYQHKATLTASDIAFLINALRYDSITERVRSDGPVTDDTVVTKILVSHGAQTRTPLLAALSSSNGNVRRYSAFCLGRVGGYGVSIALRKAWIAEIGLAEHSTFQIAGQTGSYYFAPLHSMVKALYALEPKETPQWLLSQFATSRQFRNLVINTALDRLFPASGVLIGCKSSCLWTDAAKTRWKRHLDGGAPTKLLGRRTIIWRDA